MNTEQMISRKQIRGTRKWYNDTYIDVNAYRSIASAKTHLLLDYPFWGFMGLDLVLVEAPKSVIPTLATDGYHIFYSASFINELSKGEVEFGVVHEVYHCVFGHTRGEHKINRAEDDWDSDLWNRACDYVINYDLVEAGIGATNIVNGKHKIGNIFICYDEQFAEMSAEEVYLYLLENGADEEHSTIDVHMEIEIDNGGDDSENQKGNGAKDAKSSSDGTGSSNIKVVMSQDQYDKEANRWYRIAQQAVSNAINNKSAGTIPAHLRRLIDNIDKPKIHWSVALRKFVVQIKKPGYSFLRPDKKTFGTGITLPGFRQQDRKLEIAVAIDTSGSISQDELTKFLSELNGILKSFSQFEVHAFCFEWDVDEDTYMLLKGTSWNASEKFNEYVEKVSGGGGTSFQSVWNFMKKKKIKPRGLVFFTDGYPNDKSWVNESQYCPTMFVTVGNTDNWKAPFGLTVAYEDM